MPSKIKKFNLTYAQVPGMFGLDKVIFYDDLADTVPNEVWRQNAKQKEQVAKTVDQLKHDTHRTRYLDVEDRRVPQLKKNRLITRANGDLALAPGVYPDFSQGSDTGRLISKTLFDIQLLQCDPDNLDALMQGATWLDFSYVNALGEPAGFSLTAQSDCEPKGWIIASIQNTTAHPDDRKVTVLATPNYVTSKAQSTVSMDNLNTIEKELKAAICHDKIAHLIKGIFNADGSLNATNLAELQTRLIPNQNLDDRDRKEAQLQALFDLADARDDKALNTYITSMKQAIADDINFFKTDVFEPRLHELLHKFRVPEDKRIRLKQVSKLYADVEMLAEEHVYDTKKSPIYKKIAEHIKQEIQLLKFDDTPKDNERLATLSQLKASGIEKIIDTFYNKSPLIKKYKENKKNLEHEKKDALAKLDNPTQKSFFDRNFKVIGYSVLTGSIIALTLGLALIASVLPPLAIALIAIGTALAVSGGLGAGSVYANEQKHSQKTKEFGEAFDEITASYDKKFTDAEHKLQKTINIPFFLTPPGLKHTTGPSPLEDVPMAENRFTLWGNPAEKSDDEPKESHTKTPDSPNNPTQK